MQKLKDMTGQRFGRLTVIERDYSRNYKNEHRDVYWLCKCDCGNIKSIRTQNLKSGNTQSCGCLMAKDLIGQRFGKLTVVERDFSRKGKHVYWLCKCDCGNITSVFSSNLKSGNTQSCGCLRAETRKQLTDMTGQKFGRLTVIERDYSRKGKHVYWLCKCDCGNITSVFSSNLRRGETKSCGCLRAEIRKQLTDMTGQKFGRLTVIERDYSRKSKHVYWLCKCDCGNITSIRAQNLRSGHAQSCGCLRAETRKQPKDMTGQKFGKLTVVERDLNRKNTGVYWLCKCDCGNIKSIQADSLRSGHTQSCGCLRIIDLTGQRFGRLTVIERDFSRTGYGAYWLCKCDCGNIKSIRAQDLKSGHTQSCGCLRAETCIQAKKDN